MSEEERQAIIHLLDKQARYEYCIKNNISFSDEDYEAYIIRQSMINKEKETQQKEFIKYLEDEIKLQEEINDIVLATGFEEILQKYKEIIGDDKE